MDFQHVRAFVAVAREGNLTRAAECLHLTQPAVSVQLKNFQQSLDLTLLVRTGSGLSLTADGREILPLAERILEAAGGLKERAAAMQDSVRGDLLIGTTLNPEVTRLGAFLQRLVLAHPQMRIKLHQSMSGTVREQILRGALDAGYYVGDPARELETPELHTLPLTTFTFYPIAPKGWKDRVTNKGWAELAAMPWIWAHAHSVHSRLLSARFTPLGVKPKIVAEADVEASMLDMVRSGIGLALARESVAIRQLEAYGLVVLRDKPLLAQLSFMTLSTRREEARIRAAFSAVASVFEQSEVPVKRALKETSRNTNFLPPQNTIAPGVNGDIFIP
jgi:DNA-binding transcriptional LysR family regulator